MAQKDDNRVLTEGLTRCLTQASAQERHAQWQALTEAYAAEDVIDALAARYAAQQEALQRKQKLAEERQALLNTYLDRELPDEEADASASMGSMEALRQQVKGYERQFVQLQQQAKDAQGVLDGIVAQRDEAQAWNVELTKRYEQSQEALIQLRQESQEALTQLRQESQEALTQLRQESQETQTCLQRQADDLNEQLTAMTAQWQAAAEMNTELMERIDQASQYAAQMAARVARLDQLPSVRLYNALHRKQ